MATDEETGLNAQETRRSNSGASSRSHGFLGSFHDTLVEPVLSKFDVPNKAATEEALSNWRKASLVLNAARRFRYTSDLKKRPKLGARQKFRIGSLAIKALGRFKSKGHHDDPTLKLAKDHGFATSSRALAHLVENGQTKTLALNGGVRGIVEALKTDIQAGIDGSSEDLEKRQTVFGTNTYPEKPMKTFLGFVWDACQDVTLMILAVCALVSLAVGIPTEGLAEGWYDGAGILFSIAIVVLVTATSDYRQSIQFKELEDEKKKVNVEVMRCKRRQKVSIFDLVVGDIVYLSIGDIVPADGLYISGHSLVIDESSMTGESDPLQKNEEHPFLLSGTKVQDGSAIMVATGVGMNTEWGHLMATLSESGDDETPLQVRLSGVATLIGRLGLGVAVLVFIVLMIRFLLTVNYSAWSSTETIQIVNFFAIAVTIIVVAVPEGLPLAVTLTLAYAMKRMMKDKALVRKLAACETMGSATTICSDKTGTLTTNKMTVVKAWLGGSVRTPDNAKNALSEASVKVLLEGIFNNTSGDVDETVGPDGAAKTSVLGSPTETAILNLALGFGGKFTAVRAETECVQIDPFNSKRKRMGCVVKLKSGTYRAHWKGAAEIILGMCDKAVDASGKVIPLNEAELNQVIVGFANEALRTLSLAYKDIPFSEAPGGATWPESEPIPLSGFTLQAIVGIKDPLRQGVADCVALCQSAGIMVRMVTGDNINTAKAIARECGILTEGGEAIEGPVFRDLPPDEMRRLIPKLQVMARSSPTDKHTLVTELRAMGEVVAVTGDGTNDAPALHEADIGLAMGIAGTEVAKESADIIVLDDNFATIVTVAKWGRSVYNNIQKFVQFQLTVNLVALTTNFVSACVTGTAPLTAVQLLWVNLIMDTLGALALATEPPDDSLMLRPPIGRKGRLVTSVMWRNIAIMAVYQLAVLFTLQFGGVGILKYRGPDAQERITTIIFNSFVLCQVFNEFNSRDMERINILRGIFTNTVFLSVIAVTVLFQVVLVQFLGKFASTVPLTLWEWALCVGIGVVSIPLAIIGKFIPITDGKARKPHGGRSVGANGYMPVAGEE